MTGTPGAPGAPVLSERLLKTILYSGAPFFSWPWKPALNAVAGEAYGRAFVHFRRDHQDPHNLFYHVLCLVIQLGSNFGLQAEAAKGIAKIGAGEAAADVLPLATAVAWSWTLLRTREAPRIVRVLSVAAIGLAHHFRHSVSERWRELSWLTAVPEMLAVQVFIIHKATNSSGAGAKPFNLRQFLGLVALRTGLRAAAEKGLVGSLASPLARGVTNSLLAVWMLRVAQDPFGGGSATKSPFLLGFLGWVVAMATDQPWLFFYSGGFLASLTQGVAHHFAREEGTLPQLASASDELAHTTFFPNLLLHSIYQSLTSGRGPAKL